MLFSSICASILFLPGAATVKAHEANDIRNNGFQSPSTTSFYSRPDIKAPLLDVQVDDERASPKYILTNPQSPFYQSGPNIFDHHGELVWAGAADGLAANAYGLHVCDYAGSRAKHLCYFQGVQMFGRGHGYGIILDNSYRAVKMVQSQEGFDIHEFNPIDGGRSALMTRYSTKPFDFEGITNPQGLREVEEGVFEEIDLQNDSVTFRWGSLDHIQPNSAERTIVFNLGQSPAYDYFHINSVDKNDDGDYLISARHTSAVYKISGLDGHVIWTCSNGPESNFTLDGFVVWGAHHARWRSASNPENETHTIITLFNNGYDGMRAGTDHSSGLVIVVDHMTLHASILKEYGGTEGLGAVSKGSMQTLPNDNVLVGWGSEPYITEYLEDGTLVFHASIVGGGDTYRVFKADWVGYPSDPPALWTYARTRDSSSTAFFVSWNGATEVQTWNFYVGTDSEAPGSFMLAGSKDKSGFETAFLWTKYSQWTFAEAIDRNGMSLGNSSVVAPWIPGDTLAEECDDLHCPEREADFPVKYNLLPDVEGPASSFHDRPAGSSHGVTGELAISPPSTGSLFTDPAMAIAAVIAFCGILTIVVLCSTLKNRGNCAKENVRRQLYF